MFLFSSFIIQGTHSSAISSIETWEWAGLLGDNEFVVLIRDVPFDSTFRNKVRNNAMCFVHRDILLADEDQGS